MKTATALASLLICCLGDPSGSAMAQTVTSGTSQMITNSMNETTSFDDVINHDNDSVNNSGNDRGNTKSYNTTNKNSNNTTTRRSNNTRNSNNTTTTTTNQGGASYMQDNRVFMKDQLQHAPIPNPVGPVAPDSVPVLTIYGQRDSVGPVYGASLSIPLM